MIENCAFCQKKILITNPPSDFQNANSTWRNQQGEVKFEKLMLIVVKICTYMGIFSIADQKCVVRILKFKIANWTDTQSFIKPRNLSLLQSTLFFLPFCFPCWIGNFDTLYYVRDLEFWKLDNVHNFQYILNKTLRLGNMFSVESNLKFNLSFSTEDIVIGTKDRYIVH